MVLTQFVASVHSTREIADLLFGSAKDIEYDAACATYKRLTDKQTPTDSASSARAEHSTARCQENSSLQRIAIAGRARLIALSAATCESASLFQALASSRAQDETARLDLLDDRRSTSHPSSGAGRQVRVRFGARRTRTWRTRARLQNWCRMKRATHRGPCCIRSALQEAGCPSILEPPGMTRTNGKRPEAATVLPFDRGLPIWDATIAYNSAQSYSHLISVKAGSALISAALQKLIDFRPVGRAGNTRPFRPVRHGAL